MWTDARIDILKTLWVQGMSASRIAAELGEVSRNSVLGKVHRLKLAKRIQIAQPRAKPKPRVHKRQRFRDVMPMKPLFEELRDNPPQVDDSQLATELFMQPCTLLELSDKRCHWPLWTDAKPERLYCGAPTDGVYCGHHTRIAWRRRQ